MPSLVPVLVGISVAVVSLAAQSAGLTLQRKLHLMDQVAPAQPALPTEEVLLAARARRYLAALKTPPGTGSTHHKQTLWRAGVVLFMVLNVLGLAVQITTLPLIILLPLQAIGLVFNLVFAAVFLHDPFNELMVVGTVLVTLGALVMAVAGGVITKNTAPEAVGLPEGLVALAQRPQFVVWFALTLVWVAALVGYVWVVQKRVRRLVVASTTPHPLGDAKPWNTRIENLKFRQGVTIGVVSGTLSAHLLLFAKGAVDILAHLALHNQLSQLFLPAAFVVWAFLVLFLVFAVCQLVTMNLGLKRISTSVYYPLVFCVFNLTSIANGLVFYNQLLALLFSAGHGWLLLAGTALGASLVAAGVFALSWSRQDDCNDQAGVDLAVSVALPQPWSVGAITTKINLTLSHFSHRGSAAKSHAKHRHLRLLEHEPLLQHSPVVYIGTEAIKKKRRPVEEELPRTPSDDLYDGNNSQFVLFGLPIDEPVVMHDVSLDYDEDLKPRPPALRLHQTPERMLLRESLPSLIRLPSSVFRYPAEGVASPMALRKDTRRILSFEQNEILDEITGSGR